MPECLEEERTQHYRGRWHGFGPVGDDELVLFAVFEKTKQSGGRLQENSFSAKNLARSSESIARAAFTTKRIFVRDIGRDGRSEKGQLIGLAYIRVAIMRKLRITIPVHLEPAVRALCVLDRVDTGDCDGHATVGYAEAMNSFGLNQATIGKLRARIRLDLAKEFSPIVPINDHEWVKSSDLILGRITSIARVLRQIFRSTEA